jgi:hypothetical protein
MKGDGSIADEIVTGEDIAEEIVWVANRPPHVQIAQMRKSFAFAWLDIWPSALVRRAHGVVDVDTRCPSAGMFSVGREQR